MQVLCQQKWWDRGGGWGHPQNAVHMAAARLGCKRIMVCTRWANSWPGYMRRLRKCYSHLSGGSFLAGKASWALSGCLPTESADYFMLVNEWAWLRSQVKALGFIIEFRRMAKFWVVLDIALIVLIVEMSLTLPHVKQTCEKNLHLPYSHIATHC